VKPLLALLALVVLCPAALSNSDNLELDGTSWNNENPSFKLGWVSGYAKAMDLAGSLQISTCAAELPIYKEKWPNLDPQVLLQKMCLSDKTFDYDGITMGQFVSGMDSFYRDYRNQQVQAGWAIEYTRDEIKGKPASELDAEVSLWRRCAAASQTGDSAQISKACAPDSWSAPSK
jgi:hypothetical protein